MSTPGAILKRFAEEFAVPFLRGGVCAVHGPLGKDGLLAAQHGLGVDAALKDACDAQFLEAAFAFDTAPAAFALDAGTLLFAAHELIACTNPHASAFARLDAAAALATDAVKRLDHTMDPHRLLTRHLVVERAFLATRTDTHLRWWTGSETFYGTQPPDRLRAWPTVRKVEATRTEHVLWRLAMQQGDEQVRIARTALMNAMLDASPLTRALWWGDALQVTLGHSLLLPYAIGSKKASVLDVLVHRDLARAIFDRWFERGALTVGAALAVAMLAALRDGASPHIIRLALQACVHIAIEACLIEAETPGAPMASFLLQFLTDDKARLKDDVRVYFSAVGAALQLDRELTLMPAPTDFPERAQQLWAELVARTKNDKLAIAVTPLRKALERQLRAPKPRHVAALPEAT